MAITEVTNSYNTYADYGKRADQTDIETRAEEKSRKASVLEQMQEKYAEFDVTAGEGIPALYQSGADHDSGQRGNSGQMGV